MKEAIKEATKKYFEPLTVVYKEVVKKVKEWSNKNPDAVNYLRMYGVSIFVGFVIGVLKTGFFFGLILLAIYMVLMVVHDVRMEETIREENGRPSV